MKPEIVALIGVIASSTIGGCVAFLVATLKSSSDRKAFERQFGIQLERHEREISKERSDRKLDIAYKFAELNQRDVEAARLFLNEVAKETAIGFLYLDDDDLKSKIWVRNDANILVGRSPECDVILSDQRVSRQHCVIHTADGVPYIMPLNPTNSVDIDGQETGSKAELKDGARIKIAVYEFIYFEL